MPAAARVTLARLFGQDRSISPLWIWRAGVPLPCPLTILLPCPFATSLPFLEGVSWTARVACEDGAVVPAVDIGEGGTEREVDAVG
jgi:hypothetical protein